MRWAYVRTHERRRILLSSHLHVHTYVHTIQANEADMIKRFFFWGFFFKNQQFEMLSFLPACRVRMPTKLRLGRPTVLCPVPELWGPSLPSLSHVGVYGLHVMARAKICVAVNYSRTKKRAYFIH